MSLCILDWTYLRTIHQKEKGKKTDWFPSISCLSLVKLCLMGYQHPPISVCVTWPFKQPLEQPDLSLMALHPEEVSWTSLCCSSCLSLNTEKAETFAIVGITEAVLESSLNWGRQSQLEMSWDETTASRLYRASGRGTRKQVEPWKIGKVYKGYDIICVVILISQI